jgi:anti-sigma B factor antagonist
MKPASPPPHFAVQVSPGSYTRITVSGELDIASARDFQTALSEIDFRSVSRAALDLEELDFIDASGLRAVLALHTACKEASVVLAITPGPRCVQRVFELTGTDQLLPFRLP